MSWIKTSTDGNYTHPHPSTSSFSSIPVELPYSIPTRSRKIAYLLIKKLTTLTEAEVPICVVIVIKHTLKVSHTKEMDSVFGAGAP